MKSDVVEDWPFSVFEALGISMSLSNKDCNLIPTASIELIKGRLELIDSATFRRERTPKAVPIRREASPPRLSS